MSALFIVVLYTNIDLKLQNILHGPGITKWTRVLLCFNNMTLYFQINRPCNEFTSVWSIFPYIKE